MNQPRDISTLPLLPHRTVLSCAFAACLYFHLSYFFWCIAGLFIIVRGDEVEDWVPPFNYPFAATDPTDFWSNRWHSMFRYGILYGGGIVHVYGIIKAEHPPSLNPLMRSCRDRNGLYLLQMVFCEARVPPCKDVHRQSFWWQRSLSRGPDQGGHRIINPK